MRTSSAFVLAAAIMFLVAAAIAGREPGTPVPLVFAYLFLALANAAFSAI